MFCFRAYGLVSLTYINKYCNIIFSHKQRKFQNNICISMHFGFNNQFIQAMRTRPIFQKFQKKIIFFSFNIWGYDLIRKMYSGY